jgi:hypothetical protein
MAAIEIVQRQDDSSFATTWLLSCTPCRNKYGSHEGGREAFERTFQHEVRQLMHEFAQGSADLYNVQPINGRALVQFAFERGSTRHRNTLHCHALISAVHRGKGARLSYDIVRQRLNTALGSCVHVHGRVMRNVHSLATALRYISKNQPVSAGSVSAAAPL